VLLATGERADYVAAARWFAQAAERGLGDSQFNLAVLHESGHGVTKDLSQAYFWFALAAKSGDPQPCVASGKSQHNCNRPSSQPPNRALPLGTPPQQKPRRARSRMPASSKPVRAQTPAFAPASGVRARPPQEA
jgi:TPR repeat protein